MDKKAKLQNLAANAGKAAKGILGHAIQAVDQNDDGKFDFKDVSVIAGVMGEAAKKGAQNVKASAEALARAQELKALSPIFPDENLRSPNLSAWQNGLRSTPKTHSAWELWVSKPPQKASRWSICFVTA